ncbi:MAG: carboxypeptidase-like regulatory domain-containing protein, partial [Edaphobacter sp.]
MSIRSVRHLFVVTVAGIFLLACGHSVAGWAQNISTAQLNGTVHDPSGAVVVGAAVTISDASKGFSRSTTSDGQGNYQMVLLPPGTYTVTATAPGFNKLVEQNIILTIGEQAQLPLS